MPFIRHSDAPADPAEIGGKAAALAPLSARGLPVPPWFALTRNAFFESLDPETRTAWASADADRRAGIAASASPAEAVRAALERAVRKINPDGGLLAVRSSAVDEDGAARSFAGQYESFLFVAPDEVADRVADVWRSGFSESLRAYRRAHGDDALPEPPAVLVQRMIDAEAAGVAFGVDPASGRRGTRVVSAVYGPGTSLVSGQADADAYHVDRHGRIVERNIARKTLRHRHDPDDPTRLRTVALPRVFAERPVLTDREILDVAALVERAGAVFGRPQDIEWAVANGRLYLLQSRPITALSGRLDPDGTRTLWDNSNIVESYSGVTTPLTYTFARRAYEEVYRSFCRLMRVPEARIEANDAMFGAMIGLIDGRVYYNLVNWYRLLAMLPGFRANRAFMEQMMGVGESLPPDLLGALAAETHPAGFVDRLRDRWGLLRAGWTLAWKHRRLPRLVRAFRARLDDALTEPAPGLGGLRADELVADYRRLERLLLRRWDAPIVNDFLTMIFYGVLGRLTDAWFGETGLRNDLLCGEGGIVSAEPARRIRAMAERAAPDDALVERLAAGDGAGVEARDPGLALEIDDYLRRFGDRCLEELKLESPTLHDDPAPLLRSIGRLARRLRSETLPPPGQVEARLRHHAEARVEAELRGRPLRRRVFGWVLRNARDRVRDRENLRFERTRVFGRARRLFIELGRRFYADGVLDDPHDVFYLDVHDVLGFVEGTGSTADLRALAAVRRAEFDRYRAAEPPPARFETRGVAHRGRVETPSEAPVEGRLIDGMRGTACCPGRVRGRVRRVTDPRDARLEPGEILVAAHTDPGWVMLFPSCAGLLVERGSLLSHSAIVSRELGIPSIVGLRGVMDWLQTGDWIEMDGRTGWVYRLGMEANVVDAAAHAASNGGTSAAAVASAASLEVVE